MRLVCPSCGAVASAEAWANDVECRQTLPMLDSDALTLKLSYLALFRPRSGYVLRWSRVRRLAKELMEMIHFGHIQVGQKPSRPAPEAVWTAALERIVDNPPQRLPLKNHNYLKTVVYDLADTADRQAEVRRNKAERTGDFRPQSGPDEDLVSISELKNEIKTFKKRGLKRV